MRSIDPSKDKASAVQRLHHSFRASAAVSVAALALAVVGSACSNQIVLPDRPLVECPDPMLPCLPGTFSDVRIDTSSLAERFYLAINRVEGLDREANEFGVAFPTGPAASREGFATVRDDVRDGIITVKFEKPDRCYPLVRMQDRNDGSSIGGGAQHSADDSLYFTARRPGTLRGDYDLYVGMATSSGIDAPRRLLLSTKRFWDAQPAMSPDGRSLFFASDRPGGLGGVDLYVARRDARGRWSRPVNLGSAVNTPCDELTPFISGDGKWFYFSSSGHATVGGYDIFRAPLSRGEVGRAENIGAPVNTVADEIFPSSPSNANPDTLLYYGSNQIGSMAFDVYVLHPQASRRASTSDLRRAERERITLRGTVRNASGLPVDSALVRLQQKDPPGDVDSTITNKAGTYEFKIDEGRRYELTAGSERSLYTREEILVPRANTANPFTHDINLPDTVTLRINFPFNNATDPYEFTLDDRGMPSGERWIDLIDRAAQHLSRLSPADGSSVLITGHTDPIGSDAFNQNLGRRRAEFVRHELVKRGVKHALLAVDSEGEARPLSMHDGEQDELFRARLRRVELVRRTKNPK